MEASAEPAEFPERLTDALDATMELAQKLVMISGALNATQTAKSGVLKDLITNSKHLGELLKKNGASEGYVSFQAALSNVIRSCLHDGAKREVVSPIFDELAAVATALINSPAMLKERNDRLAARIPVLVLTGFLGSGKTTLLNYVLSQQHGRRIAVIENEFGEVGIDDALVKGKFNEAEEIFEMNNGCICCTVRGDLIRILGKLKEQRNKFDCIIIETTGLADPAPIAQTFFVEKEIAADFRVDAIVTV
jgi:hypothetical protein